MYLTHWDLDHSPFHTNIDPAHAYPGSSLEEARARIEYLVAERRRMGVLLGERGMGKSTVLASAAIALAGRGAQASVIDAVALSPRELLWQLASDWGTAADPADDIATLWRRLADHLTHNRWLQKPTVLMLDDAAQASPDIMRQLVRLARIDNTADARWTMILALEPQHLTRLDESLLHLIDLRVDLYPWDETDTIGYVQDALIGAGRLAPIFTDEALSLLHTLTEGTPRHVARLADFSLLAGAAAGLELIDSQIVENAFGEISWTPTAAV